jgi:dTMP kinase
MIFISLEGIDGSGKTTIAKIVKDKLVQKGFDVLLTREPGGEPISEKIRELVLDPENSEMTAWTEALLYIASRKQHLDQVIIPALKKGTIVISDRFMDSTTVYQGFARKLGITDVDEIQNIVIGPAIPDITLFFDISPEEAKVRLDLRNSASDRLEAEADEFHEKVYQGYRMLISENSNRIKVIDARKAVDVISRQAIYLIEELLEERKASQ